MTATVPSGSHNCSALGRKPLLEYQPKLIRDRALKVLQEPFTSDQTAIVLQTTARSEQIFASLNLMDWISVSDTLEV